MDLLELESISEDISEVILQGYKGNIYSIASFVTASGQILQQIRVATPTDSQQLS